MQRRPKRSVRRTGRGGTIRRIGLVFLVLVAGALGVVLGRLAWAALAVKADLDAIQALARSDLQALDVYQAAALLQATRRDVETLRARARPFFGLTGALGWLPGYGAEIQAAPALLDMAVDLATAADLAVEPFLPLAAQAFGAGQGEPDARMARGLETLRGARPQLSEALSHVRAAEQGRQTLAPEAFGSRLRGWMPRLDQALELLGLGTRAGLILPDLLGGEEPSTLLVLIQNEDELRATGGFITGVARITLAGGAVQELAFEDSYAIDDFSYPYPDPPQPLFDYMMTELWLLRDSNWSPDWPTSARAAIELYTISREAEIDGVLALNQRAIGLLIDALGPLHVDGYAEPLTGANVIAFARRAWGQGQEGGGDWWRHRKDFMAAVIQATVERLEGGLDRAALLGLYRAAARALDEKHALIYLPEVQAEVLVSELGWDGALRDDPGDYWMVVDSNVGFNKANALVTQELVYAVDLTDPERPHARLTVRHTHPLGARAEPCQHRPRYDETYERMMERCYWDYLRVYVPSASTLTHATPHGVPASALLSQRPSPAQVAVGPPEHGRNVLATLLLVQPAETIETQFEYTLPSDVLQVRDGQVEYRLLIQKQPGVHATPVRVQVRLPEGAALVQSAPQPDARAASTLDYTLTLETDRALCVIWAQRAPGP